MRSTAAVERPSARRSGPVALLGLLALSLPGCSARSSSVVNTAPPDISSYSTLAVAVESQVADTDKEKTALASQIMALVKPRERFKEVRPAGARENKPRTLLLTATITNVKKVGGTKRFMLGVGAGRANVTAQVNLTDAKTGKAVGSYTVKGESGGSAFAGGTEDAVNKASEQIVSVLLGAPTAKASK